MAEKPDHLCVLVHGLWGNPDHLKFLSTSLHEHAEDKLHILVVKRNAGSFTYDGIETGGERVANEVEETLEELTRSGFDMKKISVVGYSLGGLIARYAIGLLYSKGLFERVQPVNFTTFATPHLGVRTPLRGYHNHVWNVLAARTLSFSGRQLFGIDAFRATGRPLLSVLADADSIFTQALARFKHRSLYANIRNDRSVSYYTAAISQTDPFVKPDALKINYLKGYEDVIIDAQNPVSPKESEVLSLRQRLTATTQAVISQAPVVAFLLIFIPVGSTLFLLNSAIQSLRSRQRIRLHEEGKAGADFGGYRIPLLNTARKEVEDMFENANNTQEQDYLGESSEEIVSPTQPVSPLTRRKSSFIGRPEITDSESDLGEVGKLQFPALALTQDQFEMIENLDNVGFQKFPVHIQKHRHSHAAVIRRMDKAGFEEGYIVVKHWLTNFEL